MIGHYVSKKKLFHNQQQPHQSADIKCTGKNIEQLTRAKRAKIRTTQMVLVTSIVTLIGHFPGFIQIEFFHSDQCFYSISTILFFVSYFLSFFVFLIFMKKFRKFFLKLFLKILNYMTCKKINVIENNLVEGPISKNQLSISNRRLQSKRSAIVNTAF